MKIKKINQHFYIRVEKIGFKGESLTIEDTSMEEVLQFFDKVLNRFDFDHSYQGVTLRVQEYSSENRFMGSRQRTRRIDAEPSDVMEVILDELEAMQESKKICGESI